jgi:hypothetical protein
MALAAAPGQARAAVGIVDVRAVLPQGPHLFGEQVPAEVDVLVNTERVDPADLDVSAHFAPYALVGSSQREETREGSVVRVRYRYTLACSSLGCSTGSKRERAVTFSPAVVRYRDREGKARSTDVPWPAFRLVSRSADPSLRPQSATDARRAIPIDVLRVLPASVAAPSPTYYLPPAVLAALLLAGSLAALAAAAALGWPVLVHLRGADEDDAAPLTPLEQAVASVEAAARNGAGTPEHREALALLARELRRSGLTDLAGQARRLAWSEQPPSSGSSRDLAAHARERLSG